MATAKTKSDALGYYQSDPVLRGGIVTNQEVPFLQFIVENPIPPIIVERVSPANGPGTGTIRAASTSTLAYTAPGDTEGAAVTVAANTSVLLESGTAAKSVRVYRDSVYSSDSLGGDMSLELVDSFNNPIGITNITAAGATNYAFMWLVNHSDLDITSITVTGGTDYTVAIEAPTAGEVQTIADNTTAPTGPTFGASDTLATLASGEYVGLWIKRVKGAGSVNVERTGTVTVEYTYSGVTYTDTLNGYYRVSDSSVAGYELYLGVDAQPNFGAAPAATSVTLPVSTALTNSSDNYYAVRLRNEYDLISFNVLTELTTLDGGGNDITDTLANPTVVSVVSTPGGEVDVVLRYPGATDATLATHWRLYTTTTGVDPDTGVDTPTDTSMEVRGLAIPTITQRLTLGPYDYGTDLRFIARTANPAATLESNSTTVTQHTVTTQEPVQINWATVTTGLARGHGAEAYDTATAYGDAEVRIVTGETILSASAEVFRAALGNFDRFRTTFDFHNIAHSAAGSSAPIEAVSADEVYINVSGTRRCKIDLSNTRIEAAEFNFLDTPISLPVVGPTYTTTTATYIMIFNALTGRWTPAVKVDSSGVFTATSAVFQE